jgi:anthranilate synthase/aminodeoxychorismate synthase-like glutamine amidotransferase
MLLIIDNFDSFTYNLVQYFGELGAEPCVRRNNAITPVEILAGGYTHLVISPGPGDPDSAGVSLAAIRELAGKLPILGVCLGHQSIGQAFGGKVVRAPRPIHGKLSRIHHDDKGLFAGLEQDFSAARYHSLVVERSSLPGELEISAETEEGIVMGLRHRRFNIEGVQFHPESVLTGCGKQLLANFLHMKALR